MEFWRSIHVLRKVHSAKNVCLSSDIPCHKHNINVFNNLFAVACNFLDETNGSKTDFHHDLDQARDSNDKSQVNYVCMTCQPFFLKSVKTQDEYKKADHAMFEKTQKSTTPSIVTADPVIQAKSKAGSITSTQATGESEATFLVAWSTIRPKRRDFCKRVTATSGRTQTYNKHNWWMLCFWRMLHFAWGGLDAQFILNLWIHSSWHLSVDSDFFKF